METVLCTDMTVCMFDVLCTVCVCSGGCMPLPAAGELYLHTVPVLQSTALSVAPTRHNAAPLPQHQVPRESVGV